MYQMAQDKHDYELLLCRKCGTGSGELDGLEEKALATGASKIYIEDLRKEFLEEFAFPMLQSGALYEGRYYNGTAIARPIIARAMVQVALKEGAEAVAHGATGKGNDQVRFELTVKALAPHLKIIAPWRIWDIRSRIDAIAYAEKAGIPVPVTVEKPYSTDRNLWHISYEGGILEDPTREPREDMFLLTCSPEEAPDKPAYVKILFEKGVPVALNGVPMESVELMEAANKIAGEMPLAGQTWWKTAWWG